jgi:hypothetical protein
MRFESYTRTYSILLVCGIVAFVIMLILAVADSAGFKEEKKMLAVSGLVAVGCALAVNVTCGIQHKKMLGRGSRIITHERSGRWFFIVDLPAYIGFSVFLLFVAYRVWTGVMTISL